MDRILILLAVLALTVSGCEYSSGVHTKSAATLQSARTWLQNRAGTSGIDIEGYWEDQKFAGWGSPVFIQTGNRVEGTMGLYNVEGSVNGKRVTLVAISNGKVYYTIVMELHTDGVLKGRYADGFTPAENIEGEPFILKKVKKLTE